MSLVRSDLVQISVLHRHGARQEPVEVNGAMSWSKADLTAGGVAMALQLGASLAARYSSLLNQSTNSVESQSTDISRTVRTGLGVRLALSNEAPTAIPYLAHVAPMSSDFMLAFSSNYPSAAIASDYWNSFKEDNAQYAAAILGASGINVLVSHFGEWCRASLVECALLAEDCAQCRISNGGISSDLLALFPQLRQLQMMNNKFLFGRNSSSPLYGAGSVGYLLASKWVNDAAAAQATTTRVLHYSAHDNTIVGLLSAVGAIDIDDNQELWVPRFAQTIVLETWSDGTVSLVEVHPQNYTFGSDFSMGEFTPLNMSCMLPSGMIVRVPSCSIIDLARYIEHASAPTAPAIVGGSVSPQCWLPAEFSNRCTVESTSALCATYRMRCPTSCTNADVASVLSLVTGTCLTFLDPHFSAAAAASLSSAAAAVVGGVVIGRLIYLFVAMEERLHPEGKGYMDNIEQSEE